ncbi:penicillin-binding protein 2 [candidate division LCP-89 bacterium B3_LCP]|uniref:Penicillin-binding protein 2 n=1 Tax=candidate division LCP-89 bacterium B3_LCP TaxID=2012998 RepID=A0A532V2M8_UNCL8|nr:MAG: penicillin-binding protein 2 [candidate division LCP-89 bacterium B3_LCP]
MLGGISLIAFLFLWIRLYQLQIIQSDKFQARSEANSVRVVEELPGRTLICDRNGRVLVENRPSYSLSLIPYEAKRNPHTISELSIILSRPQSELQALTQNKGLPSYQPVKLARDIDFHTLAAFKAREFHLAGVSYHFDPKRFYPYSVAPHTLGYIAEISESEKKKFPSRKTGDIVGKSGIERQYEDILAGRKGYHYMIVNALGQITGEIEDKYIPPRRGGKLYLTIDLDLQILAEKLLAGKRGAVVALDPRNGEILAIASAPKYDPEVFTGVLRSDDWQKLQNNPDVPLLHRAIQSGYPPASTFKMVTMTAGIEEGLVDEEYRHDCPGYYRLGRIYHCFKRDGHGELTPIEAIEQSCDAFFYKLGHQLGVEKIAHYMKIFGFGSKTGVDIDNEIAGIVPDKQYLDKRYGAGKWSKGLAINISIGQGEILVTPLQLAQYCGILAMKGLKARPQLFLEMHQGNGEVFQSKPEITHIDIKPATFEVLRSGMRLVLSGEDGTAKWLDDPRWHLAGKTGTAQNPHGDDHALFVGFAPFEDPVIAVAVIVENVGFGSTHAAPIAVELMTRYLEISEVPQIVAEEEPADSTGDSASDI